MKPLLLFDLDNTLLGNDIDFFLRAYLKALGQFLSSRIPPEKMISALLSGTDKMIRKEFPSHTLEETFDQTFYPAVGIPKGKLAEEIRSFYDDIFPGLKSLTQPRPQAKNIIDFAFQNDYAVVIATNPLFPRKAIYERLEWAGIPVEKYRYQLVTTYETFHFAKPNPAYYAEIIAQLGWPERSVLMIGDSIEDDILPAAKIGIPGYLVTNGNQSLLDGMVPYSNQGPLENVLPWILEASEEEYEQASLPAHSLISILKATSAAIDTITSKLDDRDWKQRPALNEWCLTEIIAHLRDVDNEIDLPRLEKVFQEDNPFLAGIDTDPWADERLYAEENKHSVKQDFFRGRTKLLEKVSVFPESAGQRPARHAIFGPTTIRELLGLIVAHDKLHLRQIMQTIKISGDRSETVFHY